MANTTALHNAALTKTVVGWICRGSLLTCSDQSLVLRDILDGREYQSEIGDFIYDEDTIDS